jgi:ankyrin repeat protein
LPRAEELYFIIAGIYGNLQIAGILLTNGAEVDKRDSLGFTAALYAIQQRHLELLHYLTKHKASIYRHDGFGRTSMQIALTAHRDEIVRSLQTMGVPRLLPDDKIRSDDTSSLNISCADDPSRVSEDPKPYPVGHLLCGQFSVPRFMAFARVS